MATKKANLPDKVCPVCNRSFVWRKKWKKAWPHVKYCSEQCRRNKTKADAPRTGAPEGKNA